LLAPQVVRVGGQPVEVWAAQFEQRRDVVLGVGP